MEGYESVWGVLLRDYPSKLVTMYSLTGDILKVSDQVQPFLGFPAEVLERARMSVATVMHREDIPAIFKCFGDLIESEEGTTFDVFHRILSDLGRYVELSSQFFLFSMNKNPQLFFSVSSPVAFSDPLRVNCLEEMHAQSFTAQLTPTAEFASISPASLTILGLYPSQVLGKPFQDFLCQHDLEFFAERFAEASKFLSPELVFSILFRCGDGTMIPVVVTLSFVPQTNNAPMVCLCTIGKISTASINVQVNNIGSYQASVLHGLATPPMIPSNGATFDPPTGALHFMAPKASDVTPLTKPRSPTKQKLRHKDLRRASDGFILPQNSRSKSGDGESSVSPLRSHSFDAGFDAERRHSEDHERKTAYRPSRRTDLVCEFCGKTESPEWRRGPSGSNTLCNACGIKYAKKRKSEVAGSSEDSGKGSNKPRKRKPSVSTESSSSSTTTTGSNPTPTTDILDVLGLSFDNIQTSTPGIIT